MREQAGLPEATAALMLHVTQTLWSRWEGGLQPMPLAIFEYFLLLTEQHPKLILRQRGISF